MTYKTYTPKEVDRLISHEVLLALTTPSYEMEVLNELEKYAKNHPDYSSTHLADPKEEAAKLVNLLKITRHDSSIKEETISYLQR